MDELSLVLLGAGFFTIVLFAGVLGDAGYLFTRKGVEREAIIEIIHRLDQDTVILALIPVSMIASSITINVLEKTEWGYYWLRNLWILEEHNIPLITTVLALSIFYLVVLRALCFGLSFLTAKLCHAIMD